METPTMSPSSRPLSTSIHKTCVMRLNNIGEMGQPCLMDLEIEKKSEVNTINRDA